MGEMFTHCPAEMSGASRGGLGVGLAGCRRRTDVLVAILAILIRGTAGAVNLMVVVVGGVGATGAAGFPSHGSEIMVMCGMATIMSCMSEQGIMGAAGAGRGWSRKERERDRLPQRPWEMHWMSAGQQCCGPASGSPDPTECAVCARSSRAARRGLHSYATRRC